MYSFLNYFHLNLDNVLRISSLIFLCALSAKIIFAIWEPSSFRDIGSPRTTDTNLIDYDPYWMTEWNKMVRDMDRSLGRVFNDIKNIEAFPVVDVTDAGKEVVVHAELPGIPKENIKVELLGDMLTISGHGAENKDYETASGWIRERRCGSFTRRLPIPRGVDIDKVATRFEDGLLELRIPRRDGAKPIVRKIDVQ